MVEDRYGAATKREVTDAELFKTVSDILGILAEIHAKAEIRAGEILREEKAKNGLTNTTD
jgi:hypothetical protein